MNHEMDAATQKNPAAVRKGPLLDEGSQKRLLSVGGVLGALGMSSCCILPLVLFSVGVTGTWIGNLAALYPYKWYFFIPAAVFIAGGFYKVYRSPKVSECEADTACATPASDRFNKTLLWFASALALSALVYPYFVPYLLES